MFGFVFKLKNFLLQFLIFVYH